MRKRKWKKKKEIGGRWFDAECKKKKEELIETIRKVIRGEISIKRRKKRRKNNKELIERKKSGMRDR